MKISKRTTLIIAVLLAAVMLFVTCSCGIIGNGLKHGDKNGENDETPQGNGDNDAAAVTVDGVSLSLTYGTSHGALHYSEDGGQMERGTVGSVRNIICRDGDRTLFIMRMVYFRDKDVAEVMAGSEYDLSQKTMNGITYTYFEYDDPEAPSGKGHTYMYVFEGTTYSISFVSEYDVSSLEDGFFKTVYFEHADLY